MKGFTLLEVVVVLVLLGLFMGLATVAMVSLRPPRQAGWLTTVDSARASAIRTGVPVTLTITTPEDTSPFAPRTAHWVFLPDDRALGPNLDPLTGAVHDAR